MVRRSLVALFCMQFFCACGNNSGGTPAAIPTSATAPAVLTAVGYGVDCPGGSQPFAGGQGLGYGTEYVCIDSSVAAQYGEPEVIESRHGVHIGKLCNPQGERACGERSFCQAVGSAYAGYCRRHN